MSEEIKDYIKRCDELELKLTGKDKETLQWLIFSFNECARILEETEKENQQLKEENKDMKRTIELFSNSLYNCDLKRYKSVLDEIREQLKLERKIALSLNKPYTVSVIDKLLDKVKEC